MKNNIELTNKEFELFQKLIFKELGITLLDNKKTLVTTRLYKQLYKYNLDNYSDYYRLLQINSDEKSTMLNLITTNETYFFREKRHFEFIEEDIVPKFKDQSIRVWSAASSVGAEAYSIAMILDYFKLDYKVIASDINSEVIKKAKIGLYPVRWSDKIPLKYKVDYCLRGKRTYDKWFLVDRVLIKNMEFYERNLMNYQKDLGLFDIIFLRNVLIYFNKENRTNIILNCLKNLQVGGYIITSLTERIENYEEMGLKKIETSIFQKVKDNE